MAQSIRGWAFLLFLPEVISTWRNCRAKFVTLQIQILTIHSARRFGCNMHTRRASMRSIYTYLLTGALALSMSAPAMAKDHHDRDRRDRRDVRHEVRHDDHHRARRDTRWNDHDRDDRRNGWAKGKKTGWHGNSVPPGQAKRHNDHDRDDWARTHRRSSHHSHAAYSRNNNYPNSRTPVAPANPAPVRNGTQNQHGRGPLPVPNTGGRASVQKPNGQNRIIAQAR
jgi:hypothetical protein